LRSAADWEQLVTRAAPRGLALELARHCALQGWDGQRLRLVLDPGHLHLHAAGAEERLRSALADALGCALRLEIVADSAADQTPAQRQAQEQAQQLAAAEQALATDPVARGLRERFDAESIPGTLKALRA
jgi:DNA polymerase-3 subunit gamma/tau